MKLCKLNIIVLILCISGLNIYAKKPDLKWAADAEGNAPYIIPDPRNPTELIGFEVDIANALARLMGMNAVHVQNQWDGLIPGLQIKNYDIAMNGIEVTEDRKQVVNFSDPYYVTYEQLVVMENRTDINTLSDLIGKKVGALKSSLAEKILETKGGINISTYDGEISAMTDMANGRLDAVLCDAPIALYYAKPDPRFKLVGQPIGEVTYSIAIRKDDTLLLNKINSAINKLTSTGKLRQILEEWNLWNYMMAIYLNDKRQLDVRPIKFESFLDTRIKEQGITALIQRYITFLPLFGKASLLTLAISLCAMVVAILVGLFISLTRVYAPKPFNSLAVAYIELIRGTPLIIQLYFIYYALPNIGISLSPFVAAFVGLGLNYAAYEAENYRAGLFSVHSGQMEAAVSLGMSRGQSLKFIILPQAIRLVIPPMTNDFISLLKDSSIVSVITMVELTKVYFQLASTYYDFLGTGLMVAVFYFIIGLPFVRLARYVEKKYAVDKRDVRIRNL